MIIMMIMMIMVITMMVGTIMTNMMMGTNMMMVRMKMTATTTTIMITMTNDDCHDEDNNDDQDDDVATTNMMIMIVLAQPTMMRTCHTRHRFTRDVHLLRVATRIPRGRTKYGRCRLRVCRALVRISYTAITSWWWYARRVSTICPVSSPDEVLIHMRIIVTAARFFVHGQLDFRFDGS